MGADNGAARLRTASRPNPSLPGDLAWSMWSMWSMVVPLVVPLMVPAEGAAVIENLVRTYTIPKTHASH